jgi:FkbM family methyltransferase
MIDIGANIGTTAIPRLLLGDVERVYGVEPDPTNHAALERTIAANGLTTYVHVDRAALGAADGEADLLVASRLGRHRLLQGATTRATIRVPALRLDTWSARLGEDLARVRYVKCDTQGWEAHIIAGAPGLLARRSIVWEIEVCPPLLEAAGSGVDELCATLARHFGWFVDLRADDETLDRRPIGELAAAVRAAVAGPRNYTNVILGNDSER